MRHGAGFPRWIAASLAAILAAAALAAGAGAAAKPRVGATVSAFERFDSATSTLLFYGRVKSPKKACSAGRKVQLRVRDNPLGHPLTIGAASSDASGRWKIHMLADSIGADYVARAPAKRTARLLCRPAVSDLIVFHP
ncbi:MAG: hypothetical protein U0R52_05855 [Solirubrobacterales bacterium]